MPSVPAGAEVRLVKPGFLARICHQPVRNAGVQARMAWANRTISAIWSALECRHHVVAAAGARVRITAMDGPFRTLLTDAKRSREKCGLAYLKLGFVTLLLTAVSCAPSAQYEIEREGGFEEQTKELVYSSATAFSLKGPDSKTAWQRVRLFFETYTSHYSLDPNRPKGMTVVSSRNAPRDRFFYEVTKTDTASGAAYKVLCIPRLPADIIAAQNNAKNVARFVREGTLELALLAR